MKSKTTLDHLINDYYVALNKSQTHEDERVRKAHSKVMDLLMEEILSIDPNAWNL